MASEPTHHTHPAPQQVPAVVPLSYDGYMKLVEAGEFDGMTGQIELIEGQIVRMNPQGPQHADPIDVFNLWSIEQTRRRFTVRVQLPIALPQQNSCPEPDIAWVSPQRYRDRFPSAKDVHLLIEISATSGRFDRTKKMNLYAAASIPEYWRVDVPSQSVEVYRDPDVDQKMYRSLTTYDQSDVIHPVCLPEAAFDVSVLFPKG